jgi:hypothetical protein
MGVIGDWRSAAPVLGTWAQGPGIILNEWQIFSIL